MSCFLGRLARRTLSCRALGLTAGVFFLSSTSITLAAGNAAASRKQTKQAQSEMVVLHNELNQTLQLNHSELITVNVDIQPERPFMMQLAYEGQLYTLDMQPHSVRADHYQLIVQTADGTYAPHQPGPVNTFRGTVLEIPGSVVTGGIDADGFSAVIHRPEQEKLWIEPVVRHDRNAPGNLHLIYSDRDGEGMFGDCGTDESQARPLEDFGGASSRGAACGTGLCFAEMACDADVEFFNLWGSVTAVENRINSIIATMNEEYENDVQITHVITAIIVRTAEPDPYSSTNSSTLVAQVRNEWENNLDDIPRDITHMFTHKDISGSTIGQAYNIGVTCSDQAYSYASSNFGGATLNRLIELSAHENGHVWNGIHCDCSGFTMHTPLNSNPLHQFTIGNINRITALRDFITCLGSSGGLDVPFEDNFNSTVIDNVKWTANVGASVDGVGSNEPSGNLSLRINGTDTLTSNTIDLSAPGTYLLTYWWQRTGGGNSPEAGEDLKIEYLNNSAQWIELNSHPGDGSDSDPYQLASVQIPADGKHTFFRMRIRGTSPNAGSDDFFVDDLHLGPVVPAENNDFCGGGTPVTVAEGVPHAFNTLNASKDGAPLTLCGGDIYNDIWYRYFPTCSGQVTVDVCDANFDARIAIYKISCFSAEVACDDNSCTAGEAEFTFNADAGFLYWIRVGATVDGVMGTGTLNIECATPVNGACCMPDGSCTTEIASACATNGGSYQGDGSDCGTANCPQPEGACCMPDGLCNADTEADCDTAGGTYQGDGTDCGGVSCPQPCPADLVGGDGIVDVSDLFALLAAWNTNGLGADLAAPTNIVDTGDLFVLLAAWGSCD